MIKRIVMFAIILVIAFVLVFFLNNYLVQEALSFSMFNVYLFHAVAASVVYVIIELIAEKLPTQAGYAYLGAIFLKIGFFVLIFKDSVFVNDSLTKPEKISLVVPLFLFLIIEAIGVSKLLNSK